MILQLELNYQKNITIEAMLTLFLSKIYIIYSKLVFFHSSPKKNKCLRLGIKKWR